MRQASTIALEYSVYLANGSLVASNRDSEPLMVTLGSGQLPLPLEEVLLTMSKGELKRVTLDMTPYYGQHDPHAHVEVPLERIPEESRFVDAWIHLSVNSDDAYEVRVMKVLSHSAILDLNHPFAGQHVLFELKIL